MYVCHLIQWECGSLIKIETLAFPPNAYSTRKKGQKLCLLPWNHPAFAISGRRLHSEKLGREVKDFTIVKFYFNLHTENLSILKELQNIIHAKLDRLTRWHFNQMKCSQKKLMGVEKKTWFNTLLTLTRYSYLLRLNGPLLLLQTNPHQAIFWKEWPSHWTFPFQVLRIEWDRLA